MRLVGMHLRVCTCGFTECKSRGSSKNFGHVRSLYLPNENHPIIEAPSWVLPLSGFQITGVPEPTTALLGSLGLLALFRRRRA